MAGLTGPFQRGSSYYLMVVFQLNHPLQKTYCVGAMQKPLPIDQSTLPTVAMPTVRHTLQYIHGGTPLPMYPIETTPNV